jgi:hypothetical protein
MKSAALLLAVCGIWCSLVGCSGAEAAGGKLPELQVVRSFREMGVRKTRIEAVSRDEPLAVTAVDASAGIRLPNLPLPVTIGPKGPLLFEIVWEEPVREGVVRLVLEGGAREGVLRVVYP